MATVLDIDGAVGVLRAGGLVAFPTETVYGLGADATNIPAVSRIFTAKGRPAEHPLIVHLGRPEELPRWAAQVPASAWQLAEAFWPGPITLVLPRSALVPNIVTGGLDTVALRVPAHPVALALLTRFGGGVAAPSANRFGRISPTEAAHVLEDLGDRIDGILDGGACAVGIESTIIDLSGPQPALLRLGGVTQEAIEAVLAVAVPLREGGAVRCPGQLPSHYAPQARVLLSDATAARAVALRLAAEGRRVAVLCSQRLPDLPEGILWFRLPVALDETARQLYRQLRAADRHTPDVIVVVPPPNLGLGTAIIDRLQRAAGPSEPTPERNAHRSEQS